MKILFFILTLFLFSVKATALTTQVSKLPVVIAPGFGNDSIDYYEPLKQPREVGLVSCLERRGFDPTLISTVPINRADWIRVAGGLLDVNFYQNKALPSGRGYGWYLDRFKQTVDEAHSKSGGEPVLVIGHSAGGWLARAAMADGNWAPTVPTSDRIRCLATVGAIHRPPMDNVGCVTRGALAYTNQQFPGAYCEGVSYVSVGGNAIEGNKDDMPEDEQTTVADMLYDKRGEGSASRVAYTSYKAVSGSGEKTGDGVVPLEWTMLEGSRQVRLDGVLHSINEAGTTIPTDRWYGSEGIIDQWLPVALKEAGVVGSTKSGFGNFQQFVSSVLPSFS